MLRVVLNTCKYITIILLKFIIISINNILFQYRLNEIGNIKMKLLFSKMEGLGNDFIIIEDINDSIETSYNILAKKMCDRHLGIGGDGLIIIKKSETADIKFVIFNQNGSQAEMCGNGIRCFAKYLYDKKIISKTKFSVQTLAGKIIPQIYLTSKGEVANIKVNMGKPILHPNKIIFNTDKKTAISETIKTYVGDITLTAVSMGNPHAVIFCDNYNNNIVKKIGPVIEKHPLFPNGTNVEFVNIISKDRLNVRVWERGVGETLACGTGACASLVASYLNNKTNAKATVSLPGGDLLIEWNQKDNYIYKTGTASFVFEGVYLL